MYVAPTGRYGKRMIAYEAGKHLTGSKIDMIREANRSPEIEAIYRDYLATWHTRVGDLLVHFNHISPISQHDAWGMREYIGRPISDTPKRHTVDAKASRGQTGRHAPLI